MNMDMGAEKKKPEPVKPAAHPKPGTPITDCVRCGTCCEKGGPAFHQADRGLIEKGAIPAKHLFTIRTGEFAYDNVKGCLKPVDSDIIKIKGKGGTWTCVFFEEAEKACTIYDDRPLECRALKCWDTRELEKIYAGRRLTRQDLVSKIEGLWDLIKDHQERCDYEKIQNLIRELEAGRSSRARRKLGEIIRYDTEIRKLVVSSGGIDPEMLDFLFGRPLTETLPNLGIKVGQQDNKITLVKGRRKEDR
jgi:Fe-S-cluster containining protein